MPEMERLLSAVATLTDEVSSLKAEVATMSHEVTATKEIVEAWTAVKIMGRFVKWASGIITGLAAIWLLMKVGVTHIVGGGK